jgi:class 3 adenylate cyclase
VQEAAAIATGRFPDIEFQLQIGRILKLLQNRRYRDVLDWSDAALASGELPPEALGTVAYMRIGSLNCLGEIETLDREAGRFATQMHALRLPNHERFARFHTLGIAVCRGEREAALAEAERSTAAGDPDSEEVVRALFDRAPSHADPALLSPNLTQEDAAISISIRGLAAAWARESDVARGAYAAARELREAVAVSINRFATTLRLAELGIEVGAIADLSEYEAELADYKGLSTWDTIPSLTDLVVARLRLALGDPDAACTLATQAHDWAHERGLPLLSGQALLVRGQAERELGLTDAALASVESAVALFQRHEIHLMRDIALTDRVRLQVEAGQATVTSSIDALALSVEAEPVNLKRQAAPDGTVTLLFSDIENSTARTAELGDAKWMELLREHNAIVRDQLAAHSGYEVKSMGDGFMLAFRSALDGLRCAIGMQRAFAARNAQADEPVRVRIGLHTGEAIKEADDFFGMHVNLAARVGGAAQGDEILVSGLLKALTESAGEFTFDQGREVELKGITGAQRVHAVEWR